MKAITTASFVCVLVSALILSACASGTLEIKKSTPGVQSQGIVYALPESVVTVAIPYTVKSSLSLVQGEYLKKATAELGEVTVSTRVQPDAVNYFEISTNIADAITWKNTFSASLNENLTLAKTSVTTEDASLAVFKDALTLLTNTNTLLERADDGVDEIAAWKEFQKLQELKSKIHARLADLIDGSVTSTLSESDQKQAEARRAFLDKALTYVKTRAGELKVRKPREIKVTILCVVDLSTPGTDIVVSSDTCPRMKQTHDKINALAGGSASGLVPSFTFSLDGSPNAPTAAAITASQSNAYVYRVPYIGGYEVVANVGTNTIVAEGPITIPQLGTFGRVYIKSTRFAKHTSELELHASTGGLKSYSSKPESVAGSAATTGLNALVETYAETSKSPSNLDALQTENTGLEAQIKNIEFQRKLAELLVEEGVD